MNLTPPSQYDFLPRFYRLTIVNVLSNIMVPLSGLSSVAFLGHLTDIHSLAGVALGSILFNLIYFSLEFLRMGTTGVTAQAVGGDDREAMLLVGLRNGLIALGLGLALLILHDPVREVGFALLNAEPEVKASGIAYFDARIAGMPAALLNFVLIGWLVGREKNNKVLVLSIVGNAANVILNYLLIIQWGWDSTGAGISEAFSQYLMLFVGLVLAIPGIQWQEIQAVAPQLRDLSAFKTTFALNRDILTRTLTEVATFTIFGNLSATMGTVLFTQNTLLMQIGQMSVYFTNGLGYAVETLAGNFKGQGEKEKFIPLVRVSVASSLVVGLSFAAACVFFPQNIFGLLTNHTEITSHIETYAWGLIFLLAFASASTMLEGYFLGLAQGDIIRNVSLIASVVGFAPSATAAWYFHNNHILWLSVSLFLFAKTALLGVYLTKSLSSDANTEPVSPAPVGN